MEISATGPILFCTGYTVTATTLVLMLLKGNSKPEQLLES